MSRVEDPASLRSLLKALAAWIILPVGGVLLLLAIALFLTLVTHY